MAANQFRILALILIVNSINCWHIPSLPANKRAQYYLIYQDGGYKYGYDTGVDHHAQQAADASNEVEGSYSYTDAAGNVVDQKYKAGKEGFVPLGAALLAKTTNEYSPILPSGTQTSGDASYSFSFDTDTYKRTESSDTNGNIRGRYSYSNDAGTHDLNYIAGADTGFVAQSGSLSNPNGLGVPSARTYVPPAPPSDQSNTGDGSYNLSVDTPEYQRQETSDAQGNVKGSFSYSNSEGTHDLSYIAGVEIGFKPTGGSLASPNGLKQSPITAVLAKLNSPTASSGFTGSNPGDGSYSFSFKTGDQEREESSDTSGNVKGRYSYTNPAGVYDLSYIAGSETGFVATGGSLTTPNGKGASYPTVYAKSAPVQADPTGGSSDISNDGSYSFSYNTGDQERQESSDPNGNVKGRYSYQNSAGVHDLSYIAGADTGFVATGGSLSAPNGLGASGSPQFRTAPVTSVTDDSEGTTSIETPGDGSYSFSYKTGDQSREESADSSGNVKGRYAYTNSAGSHDLSYKAGAETGFVATGGSLALPNSLGGSDSSVTFRKIPVEVISDGETTSDALSDGSYRFSFKTADQNREESSDADGNVKGRFSYTNSAGSHDLSYKAGSETGFVATGGSLAVPNGLTSGATLQISETNTASDSTDSSATDDTSGDASYSFSYKTDNHEREESSDAAGNVKGRYSYTNPNGVHDLSYTAGDGAGFLVTGGSLFVPGLGAAARISATPANVEETSQDDEANTGDASYSFTIDTDEYKRKESSDAGGNVQGEYSYKNNAGTHGLMYVAGSATGFQPTGGSLSLPNGLSLPVLSRNTIFGSTVPANVVPLPKTVPITHVNDGITVKSFLEPGNVKFGYIFEA